MRAIATLIVLGIAWAMPAHAQKATPVLVTSAGPERVSVTLYRAPGTSGDDDSGSNPQGYALITETRTVTVPKGVAVIRFEGVAGNILPQSALVSGLPNGVEEKNLDADLLSPRTLFDRALGRRVIIRRTDRATGKVRLLQATIRSSSAGAAVLRIGNGFGDLNCSGMSETLVYDGVPEGLSAKPTLSIRTVSRQARTVTLTLAYIAGGFDWHADYVVSMLPDGRSAEMTAWITLASSDVTSFPNADLQVVAGNVSRDRDANKDFGVSGDDDLNLKCWPVASYGPDYDLTPRPEYFPPPPPAPMAPPADADIAVTGTRIQYGVQSSPVSVVTMADLARQEQLGDLKLYRFPRRVTVASNAQKQVAMISKPSVKLWPVYQSEVGSGRVETRLLLRGKNIEDNGLGTALPSGKVSILGPVGERTMLVAESSLDDKAVGEDVEIFLGTPDAGKVLAAVRIIPDKNKHRPPRYELIVVNRNLWPVEYEARFQAGKGSEPRIPGVTLGKKDGRPIWKVIVPAGGTVTLGYTLAKADD